MNNDKPNVSLALILNKDGQVLAVSRKNDPTEMGFPGGKSEADESPITTLNREVYEETGLNINSAYFLTEGFDENGYLCKLYICDYYADNYFDPKLAPTTEHDTGIIKWMDWSDFLKASKTHEKFNTDAYDKYRDISSNSVVIIEGEYYIQKRTGEVYHIEYITEDNWVMLWSSFTNRPITIPLNYIQGKVDRVPRVMYDYSVTVTQDMSVQPSKYSLAERAKVFAIGRHNKVHQEYDDNLYSKHLCDVVDVHKMFSYLLPKTQCERVEAILWNHDVIEDAQTTWNDIKKNLGESTAEGSYAMTNNKGRNRSQRADTVYYDGLKDAWCGEYTKLCDRIANVSNGLINGKMLDGYRKEQPDFKAKLQNDSTYQPMWDYLDGILDGTIQPTHIR